MGERLDGKEAISHLLRRAGFGQTAADRAELGDLTFEEVVERLLVGLDDRLEADPDGFDPYLPGMIQQLWLERMLRGEHPLAERLALFWHGHFATSDAKVDDAALLWRQYRLLRNMGGGRFHDLVLGVSRDVAMIRWLDGNSNRKGHPNENYARELQELFTLGLGAYTEDDIREVARAFTGWGSRHHDFVFSEGFHDGGQKTIHGQTGSFGGEDVVRILVELPACHAFVCERLLRYFSHPEPSDSEVLSLAKVFAECGGEIRATLRALFLAPAFRDRDHWRALVKSPVEFAIGALRAAGFGNVPRTIQSSLDQMGQILFRPPSVKGWPSGVQWLSSAGVVERLRLAGRIADEAPLAAASTIDDVALDGVLPPALQEALTSVKGRDRIAFVLGSPEFQLA